ncbi:MAG: glycoside hydrolase family 19 protein [Rhizomicrobium sp.]
MITFQRLADFCPQGNRDIMSSVAPPMDDLGASFGLGTLQRWWCFLGQIAVESTYFTRLREDLWYSAGRIAEVWPELAPRAAELAGNPEALANAAYANRFGNGDEASGDGYRFRGRGLIQITFRDNYANFGDIAGIDLVNNAAAAAEPATAVKIALAYWQNRGCNQLADQNNIREITLRINGGLNALPQREIMTGKAERSFPSL